jgi:hypothetical protein
MGENGKIYTVCGHPVSPEDWLTGFCPRCPPDSAWPGLCAAGRRLTPPLDPDVIPSPLEWGRTPCTWFGEALWLMIVQVVSGGDEEVPCLLCRRHAFEVLAGKTANWLISSQMPQAAETSAWQAHSPAVSAGVPAGALWRPGP